MFDGGKALLRVLQTQEGTGVALGQAVVVQSLRHRLLQPEQAQLVGHGGLAAAQLFRRLLLSGGTGLGKTFLSACIAREVSDAGFSVVYDTAISVFSRYEDAKFRPDEVSDADVRRCESCDLLILDDLGTEMTTAFVQSALYQIVNGRMLSGRSTIISTNLAPEELGHRYGAPILSRIEGAYQILPFFGEDIRTKQ